MKPSTPPNDLPPRRRLAAFTLVEVTLAIGLVAFALTAILGSVPVGLQTLADAQAMEVAGSIVQQMQANLQKLSFSPNSTSGSTAQPTINVHNLSELKLYYTLEGTELPSLTKSPVGPAAAPTAADQARAFYRAEFTVSASRVFGTDFGIASAAGPDDSRTVTVILKYPQGGMMAHPKSFVYSFVVARQRID